MSANDTTQKPSGRLPQPTKGFSIASWALVVLWACFIFFMSANTSSGLNTGLGIFSAIYQWLQAVEASLFGPGIDVIHPVAHFLEYTLFGILLANALRLKLTLGRACLLAIAVASLYGVTDELHQYFVPGRACDPADWLVDTLGGALGAGLSYLVLKRRK